MKAALEIECIGDGFRSEDDFRASVLGAILDKMADRRVFGSPKRWWVAEITGRDPKYGYRREFLHYQKDYSRANSTGTRGIYATYVLDEGRLYEVSAPQSWSATDRYFCTVRDGRIVRLSQEEADDWVDTMRPLPVVDLPPQQPKTVEARGHKRYLDINVLDAARERIAWTFDTFPRIYVSFSGGKDSTVMLHLVMDEAIKRRRKVGVLFVDLEAQYQLTIEHVQAMYDLYSDHIEPYWVALPIILRNAVSQFEPRWTCWGDGVEWVRQPPPMAITDRTFFPFFRYNMEFEEFVPAFGHWYSQGQLTACFVGIRADESLNRYRTIVREKNKFEDKGFTTWGGGGLYNVYPIYDWRTQDIWAYNAKFAKPYNRLYDRMHQAGLTIHQMRICQPYGDDQRKGLWLFQVVEPETWAKIVARVNGANQGALYAQESGNILGRLKITKPDHLTWQQFAQLILETLPPKTREHYEAKIAVFLHWWQQRGYPDGIPDFADPKQEAGKEVPSWRRICKTLLRNDYWCKGLSFDQTKSEYYERYLKLMKRRRQAWGL